MDETRRLSRRALLTGLGGYASVATAGCLDNGDTGMDRETSQTEDKTGATITDRQTDTTTVRQTDTTTVRQTDTTTDDQPSTTPGSLDLREANVVDVSMEAQDSTYNFDVTLHHDDDGEDGYANWWQVERLDGTSLGRRELLHPHSNQPFTRSDRIEIPDEVICVVVRGHDQTHGYGGVAMIVNLESGAMRSVDQGAEQQSFDEEDCP